MVLSAIIISTVSLFPNVDTSGLGNFNRKEKQKLFFAIMCPPKKSQAHGFVFFSHARWSFSAYHLCLLLASAKGETREPPDPPGLSALLEILLILPWMLGSAGHLLTHYSCHLGSLYVCHQENCLIGQWPSPQPWIDSETKSAKIQWQTYSRYSGV